MHPVITRQLAAHQISETLARAEDERRAREARRPRCRAPAIRLSGVVTGVLGVVHAFGDLRPEPKRRGDGLHENGSALDDVRAGLGEEAEELADDQGKGEDPLLSSFNI
jgi:hypothetical protein